MMLKSRYWALSLGCIVLMTATSFGLSANTKGAESQIPPFSVPFDTKKVGETYNFTANVTEQLNYAISLEFYIITPNKWSHFFDKKQDPKEFRKLYETLGGTRKTESGDLVPPAVSGVPAKFRVQIINANSKEVLLDKLVDHPGSSAFAYGRSAILATQNMPKGLYNIRIEYLEGAPELDPLHTEISFARAHHGK